MVREVSGFITSDDRFFEDKEKADDHQDEIDNRTRQKKRLLILKAHLPNVHQNILEKISFKLEDINEALKAEGVD